MSDIDERRNSDYDEPEESERSEDEEAEERSHKATLIDAKKEVRTVIANQKRKMRREGTARKLKLTEEDVDRIFEKFPNITQEAKWYPGTPTMLHAIFDLIRSDEDEDIDSVTVKALVQRLVQHSTHLLPIVNDEHRNPLYLAISKKKKVLADYMVVSCPEEDSNRRSLADAIEDCRGNEQGKNCLHLAFEKDMKPTTILRMLKDARRTALEAVDSAGRRPMHYAVQYQRCNIDVIRAFIERDNELVEFHKQNSPCQPLKTFLDADDETKMSVYEELVSSARAYNEEYNLKKKETLDQKKKELPSTTSEDRGKHVRDPRYDAIKGRNAAMPGKPESKPEPKPDNRFPIRPNHPGLAGHHGGRPKDRDRETNKIGNENMSKEEAREIAKQLEAEERQDRERTSARRDVSNNRHRQGPGPPTSRDALRIQTAVASTAGTRPSNDVTANTPKLLKRVPTMVGGILGDKPGKKVNETATATKKSQKPIDHETAQSVSRTARQMLKLHYMRTRDVERATWWLYKTNPDDVQTFFDYHKLPSEIKGDLFERAFQATKFDEVLKFAHFTNVTVTRPKKASSRNQRPNGGFGRQDMEFFFEFLYKKGVRHILKVFVEESGQSIHSDESIKKALDRMTVEHLDWRKVDMDPQLICGISSQADDILDTNESKLNSRNQLRQLDLQWSGNTAVLRAWSEPEGLPSLPHLETVKIIVPNDTVLYDSPEWIMKKKNEFEERLKKCRVAQELDSPPTASRPGKITVELCGLQSASEKKAALGSLQSGPIKDRMSQTAPQKIINTHEWLKCIDSFANHIMPLWTSTRANFMSSIGATSQGPGQEIHSRPVTATGLENEVIVALIDDGVSLLDDKFAGHVLEGKTFDYHEGGVGQSYNSAQGHGTEMARCILRVCPMAKIYPIRLKTHISDGKSEIDLDSAALALNAALEKKATIISMSWTIPVPKEHSRAKVRFEAAVREITSRKDVLLFCSSPDKGQIKIEDYPSVVHPEKIFRIGAAHDHGKAFEYTGMEDVDFILPGVKVSNNASSTVTGSSVATALAAGLAATIIYCFKISALAVKTQSQTMSFNKISQPNFTESAILKLSQHGTMKTALGNVGWVNKERFIQVWDKLQPVVDQLEDIEKAEDHDYKVRCVMDLCNQLVVLQAT